MCKTVVLVWFALMTAACAEQYLPTAETVEQGVCTIPDQMAGICTGNLHINVWYASEDRAELETGQSIEELSISTGCSAGLCWHTTGLCTTCFVHIWDLGFWNCPAIHVSCTDDIGGSPGSTPIVVCTSLCTST